MAYILIQLCVVLLTIHSAQCQVISGRNPFTGRTVVSDDNIMEQILLKLQKFEKKVVNQENMIEKVLKENENLQNSIKRLQKENVHVKDDMKQLQKQNMDLEESVNQVQTENVNLQNQIKQLQQENIEQTDKITQLENKLTEKTQQGSQVKMVNAKQDEDLKHINGRINSQQHNFIDMKKENLKSVESLEKVEAHFEKQNSFVSFTAYATDTHEYNADDVVQFDGIVVNDGGFYNESTSIFTCLYSGYYTFSVSVLASSTNLMAVDIMLSVYKLVSAHAYDVDTYGEASTTTTVKCDSGQQVWVRNKDDGNRMGGNGNRFSSFTGTLLRVI